MVYPKHQVLPSSPRKKVKTSTAAYDFKTSTTQTIDIASNFSDEANYFTAICEMLVNCNTMIATNIAYIKKIEEENAKNTAMLDKKFDELVHHAKSLEQRLEDTEDRTNTSNEDSAELNRAVGTFVDSGDILESHLGSIEGRVSSIERLIIRSRKRKLSKGS